MRKISVLFDASPIMDSCRTGVGYYTAGLIESLARHNAENLSLRGYYFDFLNKNHKRPPHYDGVSFKTIWLVPGKLLSLCRRFRLQPPLNLFIRPTADIIFFTNYVSLPLTPHKKTVLAIYDLGFLDCPQYIQPVNLTFLQRFCPASIRHADIIVTISEYTKRRILHYFPNIKAKIIVTPIPPVQTPHQTTSLNSRLTAMSIAPKRYLLYLGTLEPRKNIQNLVRAYAQLPREVRDSYALVLAGGKGWRDEGILAEIAKQRDGGANIVQTGYTSDEEKSALYANASCFVLPSHYEGFGMPILEAMQHDIPVALSDIPVFHEVAGDAAIYFDKDSPDDISQKLLQLLMDTKLHSQLVSRSKNRLAACSWQDNAAVFYEALSQESS